MFGETDFSTEWIEMCAEDTSEVFYQKLVRLKENQISRMIEKFEGIHKYLDILKMHQALFQNPYTNIKVTFTVRNGFHLSSCDYSNPLVAMVDRRRCTCTEDFKDADAFLRKVSREHKSRCVHCHRLTPEWEAEGKEPEEEADEDSVKDEMNQSD